MLFTVYRGPMSGTCCLQRANEWDMLFTVYRGPTRVNLKQSLWLNFSVDTSARQFGAIEFLLLNSWDKLLHMTEAEQRSFLNLEEAKEPLHTVPAGFR